jgi:hypothetical protein
MFPAMRTVVSTQKFVKKPATTSRRMPRRRSTNSIRASCIFGSGR